jgi:hypothetical protein
MFLSVLVSVVGLASPGAMAQQTGGLPELTARVTALETTVASLQAVNNILQNALNAEIAARTAGDNTLQTALTQETAQRQQSVANVQTLLNAETTNRINGDQQVQDLITNNQAQVFASQVILRFLNNDFGNVVAAVTVPPGDYLLHADVEVLNTDSDNQEGGCLIEQVPIGTIKTQPPIFDFIDPSIPAFIDFGEGSQIRLDGGFKPGNDASVTQFQRLTLLKEAHVATQAEFAVTCVGFNWVTEGGRLVAVKEGPITICDVNGLCQ